MTAFKFEFKDQMLNLKTKPQPKIGTPGGTCKGCIFQVPLDQCTADAVRRQGGPDCVHDELVFVTADKATEEKVTLLKIAERLKK